MKVPLHIVYKKEPIKINTECLDRIEYVINHYRDIYIDDIGISIGYSVFYLYSTSDDEFIQIYYDRDIFSCNKCLNNLCNHILYLIIEVCGVYPCSHYMINSGKLDNYHQEYFIDCIDLMFKITI